MAKRIKKLTIEQEIEIEVKVAAYARSLSFGEGKNPERELAGDAIIRAWYISSINRVSHAIGLLNGQRGKSAKMDAQIETSIAEIKKIAGRED